ncbi:OmpA family protein [Ostreiculturibacter nitratireducens]|uniref:OmpA family protein n=1 Tax=Ostreiculturibacter nitratireducens TaxID=3075226 RepID=UPI0031B60EB8
MLIERFFGFLFTGFVFASSAIAQDASDLSADQLRALFDKQKTRGLVLAPTEAPLTEEAPAGAPAAQTTYVELAPDEQINIQIRFDFDSAALRDDEKPKLATLCEVMKTVDVQQFRIVGHTDASGSANYNEKLSLLRAQEVKRHLVGNCGIPDEKLEAVGVGEQFPLDKEDPNADANRRVEFQALS